MVEIVNTPRWRKGQSRFPEYVGSDGTLMGKRLLEGRTCVSSGQLSPHVKWLFSIRDGVFCQTPESELLEILGRLILKNKSEIPNKNKACLK